MKQIEFKAKEIGKCNYELINRFKDFLLCMNTFESYFILERMIVMNLFSSKIVENKNALYFVHYYPNKITNSPLYEILKKNSIYYKYYDENCEELSKNDFELHKKYVKEGVNPNEISKIIRNDEVEKLQEISSQNDFDFNQTIEISYYERYSFINHKNVTLIDYAAFFSSVKCFKYLLMNGANVFNTGKYAVAGGNEEIIHLCEQNHSTFEGAYEAAIEFHRNDIFLYLYENKIEEIKNSNEFIKIFLSNKYMNFKMFNFLIEQKAINVESKSIYLYDFRYVLMI